MKRRLALLVLTVLLAQGAALRAEEPAAEKVSQEHRWLQKFVGEWESSAKAPAVGDQPAVECRGTMTSSTLGDLWVVNRIEADVMGTTMSGIQTIGYDPAKKKYVGTWVDSIINHLWHYEGTVDEAGTTLTLEAEGPNFTSPGKTAKFRDAYQFVSNDKIIATSSMQSDKGDWVVFMTGTMQRKKK